MRYAELIDALREQGAALRESAVQAGPDIPVATCPDWRVHDLIAHLGAVHDFILQATRGEQPTFERSSGSWTDVVDRWDRVFRALLQHMSNAHADEQVWAPPGLPPVMRSLARRAAHETAIHRLDADSAVKDLKTLVFSTEFAADGTDEFLGGMLPARGPSTVAGTVLYHAADAGRVWQLRLDVGKPVVTTEPTDSGVDADLTIVGTADAVYRSVWGRPSTAVVTGDRSILAAFKSP
ncbi:maleylpyruvate isomerase family mycothiol-dependent enzyme [Kutzneria sp. CA-103260]|uniref:maleylpyruvate isomerase family mycothiol-dependent enzyme n=1 Tax=Kutzneria sp. CA-103260 TaxID=2802641 RepID=UPI001BADE0DC|nr:maleylpyruvate isomerase family mycothiol-dependent enzyme [Kutzneria sp. CA-103260]QUQ70419.1 maleylpyruvate isomerase family mycothiol-dependent enzyme [Kutzneria sp. CA-103260]